MLKKVKGLSLHGITDLIPYTCECGNEFKAAKPIMVKYDWAPLCPDNCRRMPKETWLIYLHVRHLDHDVEISDYKVTKGKVCLKK